MAFLVKLSVRKVYFFLISKLSENLQKDPQKILAQVLQRIKVLVIFCIFLGFFESENFTHFFKTLKKNLWSFFGHPTTTTTKTYHFFQNYCTLMANLHFEDYSVNLHLLLPS